MYLRWLAGESAQIVRRVISRPVMPFPVNITPSVPNFLSTFIILGLLKKLFISLKVKYFLYSLWFLFDLLIGLPCITHENTNFQLSLISL